MDKSKQTIPEIISTGKQIELKTAWTYNFNTTYDKELVPNFKLIGMNPTSREVEVYEDLTYDDYKRIKDIINKNSL